MLSLSILIKKQICKKEVVELGGIIHRLFHFPISGAEDSTTVKKINPKNTYSERKSANTT